MSPAFVMKAGFFYVRPAGRNSEHCAMVDRRCRVRCAHCLPAYRVTAHLVGMADFTGMGVEKIKGFLPSSPPICSKVFVNRGKVRTAHPTPRSTAITGCTPPPFARSRRPDEREVDTRPCGGVIQIFIRNSTSKKYRRCTMCTNNNGVCKTHPAGAGLPAIDAPCLLR